MVLGNKLKRLSGNAAKQGQLYGLTVSYRNEAVPVVTSRVGYGKTLAAALLDADSQLPDGTWRRIIVSHPGSIYVDLQMDRVSRFARSTTKRGENVVVRVERRISVVVDET